MKKSKFEKLIKETKENLNNLMDNIHELNSNIIAGTFYKDLLGSLYSELSSKQTVIADIERDVMNQSSPDREFFGLKQYVELEDDD